MTTHELTAPPDARATSPPGAWWPHVRAALRGAHYDYTDGPVGRSLWLLAIPMVLETLMESLFAVCDVFFVSRLGPDAVATVGLTESMLTLLYALAMGLSIGATATVARRIGEKDPDGAARAAVQAIALGVGVSLAIGVAGGLAAPALLPAMGATPAIVETGSTYTRIMLGGNATVVLIFLINAVFRGAGDAAIAMRVLWLANALNITLAPCLVFGLGPFPELGVTGAAVATNLGRGTGVLYQLYALTRRGGRLAIEARHLGLDGAVMRGIWRLSSTGVFQILVSTTSWVFLVRILSAFGSAVVAGNTIGIRLIVFAMLPAWGLANAAATMVGQGLGAGKPDRAERAAWLAARYNVLCLTAVSVVFIAAAHPIVAIFTTDMEVARHAVACLRTVSLGFILFGLGMTLSSALNGAGDTWTPTWINIGCFWGVEIPLAYALAVPLGWGPLGVYAAITIAFVLHALVSVMVFRRGGWKTRRV
ncbi:MAG: MATE family efflux transporter [Vicinamibacterales bacterium]